MYSETLHTGNSTDVPVISEINRIAPEENPIVK
jgi:hypothetical protein